MDEEMTEERARLMQEKFESGSRQVKGEKIDPSPLYGDDPPADYKFTGDEFPQDDRSPAEIVRQVTSGVRLLGAQLLDPADPLRLHPNILAHALIGFGTSLAAALEQMEAHEAAVERWRADHDGPSPATTLPRVTDGHLHPPTLPQGHRDWGVHSGHDTHRHGADGLTEWRA
jgi:hypothetical protein